MATVSDQTQHSYTDADEFIQYQLEKARSRIKATDLLTAGVLAGLLLVGYVLTFTLLDHWVVDGGFSAWTRAILLAVILILCGAILFRYVLRPWFRRIHPLYAARMLDRSSEQLQGSLLALIDLQAAGHKSQGAIHRTLEKRAAVTLAGVHVDEAIDRTLLTRMGTGLFIITLITCVYAVLSPKSISLLRPFTLAKSSVATRTVIEAVQPGNAVVPAGSLVEFVADLAGAIPEEVRVLYSTSDRRFVDEPLTMRATDDDEHRFRIMMVGDSDRGIRQNLTYRIEAGDATSEIYSITVEQPPTARVTEIHYVYPAYMDLPERTDSTGAIEAWEDTTLTLLAESSEPVREAVLQMSDDNAFSVRGEELQMAIDGIKLSVNWKLTHREDGTFPKFYRIQLTDLEGQKDPEPAVYPVDIRRDQPPTLKLIDPTRDLQIAANAIVPLLVEAEDPDFLLRSVTLHYAVNGKLIQPAEVLLDAFQTGLAKRWTGTWEFHLKPLNLNPGDVVTYHLEARDNRPPLGNQSRTGDLNLQITAPLSEQQVQQQLAQDRQMQDQMRDPQNSDPNITPQNPGDDQASEQPKTGENTEEPMPNDDPTIDPNQEQSPETKETDSSDNQQKDSKNGSGEQKNGNAPPEKNQGNDQQPPGQESSTSRQQDRRADDDKALQKLIERMNRDQKDPGSDSNDDKGSSQSENRRPAADDKTERPEREPGEQGERSQENDSNENQKDVSPRTDTGSSKTPAEGSGEEAKDEPSVDSTGKEKNADDIPIDPKDPKNTEGAPKSDPPPEETPEKNSNAPPGEPEKTGAEPEDKPSEQQGTGNPAEDQKQGEPKEKAGDKPTDADVTDKPVMKNENPLNMNSKAGRQSDPNKTGDETSKDSKSSGEKSSGEKSGGEKSDGEKSDGEKSDGEKSDGEKSDGEKSGGEKSDGEKSDGEKSDGEKSGGEKSGGEKSGGEKSGGEKSGGEKSGGEKSGGEKSGGEKSGGEKSGGEKSGGEKSGGEKSGGEKSGGKESGGKPSGGGEKGGSGEKSGGKQSGAGKGGVKSIDRADPNTTRAEEQDDEGQGNGGMPDGNEPREGSPPNEPEPARPADPQADDAAGAAALAIKRLQQELERGDVDPKLLEELGWTESEIKSFADRLQKQLALREVNAQQQKEKSISDKSFDAMLKGLDINSSGSTRQGRTDRDRDQQDTTTRQSSPPTRYKQLVEGYQRSVSGAKADKPK